MAKIEMKPWPILIQAKKSDVITLRACSFALEYMGIE